MYVECFIGAVERELCVSWIHVQVYIYVRALLPFIRV